MEDIRSVCNSTLYKYILTERECGIQAETQITHTHTRPQTQIVLVLCRSVSDAYSTVAVPLSLTLKRSVSIQWILSTHMHSMQLGKAYYHCIAQYRTRLCGIINTTFGFFCRTDANQIGQDHWQLQCVLLVLAQANLWAFLLLTS